MTSIDEKLMKEEWDVIVVGAGPGGNIAARDCAKSGLKTLVIDKRQELGTPVRCGEGLAEGWFKMVGLPTDPKYCVQEIWGAAMYMPNEKQTIVSVEQRGFVLERKIWEKELGKIGSRAGAKYLLKTMVIDVIKDENGYPTGVKIRNHYGDHVIKCKLIIAVDGVDSQTARFYGINSFNPLNEVDSGYQYNMANLKFERPDLIHLWLGNEICPRGYIWLFPKGDDVANVGIGVIGSSEKTAKQYLDDWIEAHPAIFKDATIIEENCGCIPVGKPMDKLYDNGFMICGDAGHMVNPIHGGGIGESMVAAQLAAKTAKEAFEAGDLSKDFLKRYSDQWWELRGNQLVNIWKVRRFFEKLNDDDLNFVGEMLTPQTILDFSEGKKLKTLGKMFIKRPKLLAIAAKTILKD